jgi:hypothetical protein
MSSKKGHCCCCWFSKTSSTSTTRTIQSNAIQPQTVADMFSQIGDTLQTTQPQFATTHSSDDLDMGLSDFNWDEHKKITYY